MADWNVAEREHRDQSKDSLRWCFETGQTHRAYQWATHYGWGWTPAQRRAYDRGFAGLEFEGDTNE